MLEKKLLIKNKLGLHARAAAKLVQISVRFKSEVRIGKDSDEESGGSSEVEMVNAKSIMGVLMLAAAQGTWVVVAAEGEDAEAALRAIEDLIEGKFGEE